MLERLISERTGASPAGFGIRVGRIVQRVSRAIALPALALMLGGLMLFALTERDAAGPDADWLMGHPVTPVGELLGPRLLSGAGLMSAGLLALALVPLITVLLISLETVRTRRWREAAVAVTVAGILILSIFLGRA